MHETSKLAYENVEYFELQQTEDTVGLNKVFIICKHKGQQLVLVQEFFCFSFFPTTDGFRASPIRSR